jgi:hypothetical protein
MTATGSPYSAHHITKGLARHFDSGINGATALPLSKDQIDPYTSAEEQFMQA